jgi:cell division protein FtsL
MKRHLIMTHIIILALVIIGLFQVKHKVQNLRKDLAEINRELAANQDAIHVLGAEWAYLNEPARIKKLSDKYLAMNYTNVSQLKNNAEIRTAYLPNKEIYAEASPPVTPTLKPILSSLRNFR